MVGAEDAGDGVLQQVAIDALPRGQHRAWVRKAEVVVGEESEHNVGQRVDLILGVAGDVDCRERVLGGGGDDQPAAVIVRTLLCSRATSTYRVSSSNDSFKCPIRPQSDVVLDNYTSCKFKKRMQISQISPSSL